MLQILFIGHSLLILLYGELIPADFALLYLTIILAHEMFHVRSPYVWGTLPSLGGYARPYVIVRFFKGMT